MRILSHAFYEKNRASWERLEALTGQLDKGGRDLTDEDIKDYPRLYRKVCADLAEARLKQLSPDLMAYLNQVVAGAHRTLYRERTNVRGMGSGAYLLSLLSSLFVSLLPGVLRRNRYFLLASFLLFMGSYGLSAALVYGNPSLAGIVVSDGVLSMMEESYAQAMEEERGGTMSTAMFTYYIQHNVSIGFISFATGVLFGLGTIYFLLFNGLQLGAITGYIISLGYGRNFLVFVTAHSVFELTGLIVAGAAGLLLGYTIVAPGNISRRQALNEKKTELLALVGSAALLITCAALIEGYLSPQPVPYAIKLTLFILCLSAELFYVLRYVLFAERGREL
ncbi:MAG: stage II sporulation protein M [Spirochaetales bacterium]|nr:stage II sporulation protein M [Spirochaetales bacterium]